MGDADDGAATGDIGSWPSSKRYNLHLTRQGLREMLLKRLHPDVVQWNRRLRKLDVTPEGATLHWEGGDAEPAHADLVVGCDGIWSSVRRQARGELDAETPLRYLGAVVVLGIVPSRHALNHERIFQTVDGTTRIFAMPYTAGAEPSTMWQLSFPMAEQEARTLCAAPERLLAEALRRCGDWHEPLPTMLRETSPSQVMGTPVFDRDPLPAAPLALAAPFDHPLARRVTLLVCAAALSFVRAALCRCKLSCCVSLSSLCSRGAVRSASSEQTTNGALLCCVCGCVTESRATPRTPCRRSRDRCVCVCVHL